MVNMRRVGSKSSKSVRPVHQRVSLWAFASSSSIALMRRGHEKLLANKSAPKCRNNLEMFEER
jgi:hypothetical protein